MTALAQDGAIDEQALTVSELDTIYSPLREQVSDSIYRQENLVSQIQVRWQGLALTGLIPGLRPANKRRRYFVTMSLICWAQA